jgi:serine protease AprX
VSNPHEGSCGEHLWLKISIGRRRNFVMAELDIRERQAEGVTVLDMDGKITADEGSTALRNVIRRLLEEGKRDILLNLSGVGYIDSTGISELLSSLVTIRREAGQLTILHLTQKLQDLLAITKLLTVFDVYESEDDALSSYRVSHQFRNLPMPDYKIFCPQSEIANLPAGVDIKKSYAAFSIVSAPDDLMDEVRKRWPVEKLETRSEPVGQADPFGLAASRDNVADQARELLVRFTEPFVESLKRRLEEKGIKVLRPVGKSAVIVSADDDQAQSRIKDVDEGAQVEPYVPVFRVSEQFLKGLDVIPTDEAIAEAHMKVATEGAQNPVPTRGLTLPGILMASFFTEEDRERAAARLMNEGVRVGNTRLIVDLAGSEDAANALQTVAQLPGLRVLEEQKLKTPSNDVARLLIGAGVVTANPGGLSLTGEGEVVAVADTGLDTGNETTLHLDFKDRVRFIKSYPIRPKLSSLVTNPGADDGPSDNYTGHGTHVAGSVLGNGDQADVLGLARIIGMAPSAELVLQAIEQTPKWTSKAVLSFLMQGKKAPVYGLFGIPDNLRDLFADAYAQGARIHSNSWGGGDPGAYDLQCEDLDRFVWEHKDFLVVVAAGNSGKNSSAASRAIDQTSVDSPGTAKNALTVGACENDRANEFSDTYGAWWPKSFPHAPFQADSMVDSVDDIVAFSSRGPCSVGRRKPDVVAPGTFILSTRSSQIAANNFSWGAYPPAKDHYMFMGGTSMATPLVAGCAVLVRQYLRQHEDISNPSAALLKAALIHSAQYFKYRFAHPSSSAPADNEQGWGRVTLNRLLSPAAPTKVIFHDESAGLSTGDEGIFKVEITDSSVPFKVTLVYSDYPSDISTDGALVNNLNLMVFAPSGNFYLGNDFQNAGKPDTVNNVEGVLVDSPEVGEWTVRVVASEVQQDDQDFALVLSGGGLQPK